MRLIGKYDIIHKIITAWDPMNLICYTDATCTKILNADEYDSEVDDIFDRIDYVVKLDENSLANVINEVFEDWFNSTIGVKYCLPIAKKILIACAENTNRNANGNQRMMIRLREDSTINFINEWNPMNINFFEAPECTIWLNEDEYWPEINEILIQSENTEDLDENKLAEIIQNVFNKWFSANFTIESCMPTAKKIFEASTIEL